MRADNEKQNASLMSPLTVLAVAAATGALLWLLFPGAEMMLEPSSFGKDGVSHAYLRMLARANPRNQAIQLRLAALELRLDHLEHVESTLAPWRDATGQTGRRARHLLLEAAVRRWNSLARESPERRAAGLAIQGAIETVRAQDDVSLAPRDLDRFATLYLALEQPRTAATIYERLASREPAQRFTWLVQAARWYEAADRREKAIALRIQASEVAPGVAEARHQALRALALRQAGGGAGDMKAALSLAETLVARFPRDPELLDSARKLAASAHDLRRAGAWGARRIALGRAPRKTLEEQLEILLGAGDLGPAQALLERLVARDPGNPRLLRELATVATWNQQPVRALEAWTALAEKADPDAREHALSLARALYDDERVALLLEAKAENVALTIEEVLEIVDSHERLGDPAAAIAALDRYGDPFAHDRRLWESRASLEGGRANLKAALAARQEIARRFGRTLAGAIAEIELLARLGRLDEATKLARETQKLATERETAFWRLYGEAAWTAGMRDDAAHAYRKLWATKAGQTPLVTERLLALAAQAGRADEVIAVGAAAFERFGDPHSLVVALDAAYHTGRWKELRALMDRSAAQEFRFQSVTSYWVIKGYAAKREGRTVEAVQAFETALVTAPRSDEARMELLWLAIERGDHARLRRYLHEWGDELAADSLFWEVLATAHDRAGQSDQASAFRGRKRQALLASLPSQSRSAPAHRRTDSGGQLLPAWIRLAMALEENDHGSVRAIIDASGGEVPLPQRIEAERLLGREETAWRLLVGAGAPVETSLAFANPDEQQLRRDLAYVYRELGEDRLSGASGEAGVTDQPGLTIWQQRAWASVRWDRAHAYLGPELAARQLSLASPFFASASGWRNEMELGLGIVRRGDVDRTTLFAGAQILPEGARPSVRLTQMLGPLEGVELAAHGVWDDAPTDTAGLRASALRRALGADVVVDITSADRVAIGIGVHRFATRPSGHLLGWGARVTAEAAHELRLGNTVIAIRADAEGQAHDRAAALPDDVAPMFAPGTEPADLLAARFATIGTGFTLTSGDEPLVSGQGTASSFRTFLDLWGGWLWPHDRLTYSAEAGVGLRLRIRQEIMAKGFFFASRGGLDERQFGATLGYTLQWF